MDRAYDVNLRVDIPTSSLQIRRTTLESVDIVAEYPDTHPRSGRGGRLCQNTQILEGTNQIQRVVVAKHLLK